MTSKSIPHSEMIKRLATRFDLAESEVKSMIDSMMAAVAHGATNEGGTIFRGFGRFRSNLNEKSVFNPKTQEHVGKRSYVSMYFKPLGDAVVIDG